MDEVLSFSSGTRLQFEKHSSIVPLTTVTFTHISLLKYETWPHTQTHKLVSAVDVLELFRNPSGKSPPKKLCYISNRNFFLDSLFGLSRKTDSFVLCCYFPRRILYYFQQIKNSSQQYLTHKAARLYPSNRCYNLHIRSHSLRNIWRNLQCVTDMHLINSFLVPLDQATFPYDRPRPIDCWKETKLRRRGGVDAVVIRLRVGRRRVRGSVSDTGERFFFIFKYSRPGLWPKSWSWQLSVT